PCGSWRQVLPTGDGGRGLEGLRTQKGPGPSSITEPGPGPLLCGVLDGGRGPTQAEDGPQVHDLTVRQRRRRVVDQFPVGSGPDLVQGHSSASGRSCRSEKSRPATA